MPCRNVCVIAIRGFVIACLVAVSGCSANYPTTPTPTPTLSGLQIHYLSPHVSISPGVPAQLILYAIDSEGVYEDVSRRASWVSGNPSVLTSLGNGSLRGVAIGTTQAIATYQGLTTAATIVVGSGGPIEVSVPRVEVGDTGKATARQRTPVNLNDVTDRAEWTSSDPRIVTVSGGNITAHAPGSASITVRYLTFGSTTVYLSVPPIRSLP